MNCGCLLSTPGEHVPGCAVGRAEEVRALQGGILALGSLALATLGVLLAVFVWTFLA